MEDSQDISVQLLSGLRNSIFGRPLSMLSKNLGNEQKTMIAGGLAGCIGKTVTAPMSRLTILYQVAALVNNSPPPNKLSTSFNGLSTSNPNSVAFMKNTDPLLLTVNRLVREEGFLSLWRGNLIMVMHRFPYSAINFATYEYLRKHVQGEESPVTRFFCGATSGAIASVSCYPLDLLRTRVAVSHPSAPHGTPSLQSVVRAILAERGPLGLYRGLSVAFFVNVPALAISFSVYGSMKDRFLSLHSNLYANLFIGDDDRLTPLAALISGSVSGMISSLLLYPADVIRRRMQLGSAPSSSPMAARAHVKQILRQEGLRGFYRGILPEMLKVAPMVGVTFCCYEFIAAALKAPPDDN